MSFECCMQYHVILRICICIHVVGATCIDITYCVWWNYFIDHKHSYITCLAGSQPGAHFTNNFSILLQIQWKFPLVLIQRFIDHYTILHTTWQLCSHGMWKYGGLIVFGLFLPPPSLLPPLPLPFCQHFSTFQENPWSWLLQTTHGRPMGVGKILAPISVTLGQGH